MSNESARIFLSYAEVDNLYREELVTHLAPLRVRGVATVWDYGVLEAGLEWREAIDQNLQTADLVVLLLTPDYLATSHCFEGEFLPALARRERGDTQILPIHVRACSWHETSIRRLRVLFSDAPIATYEKRAHRDTQWTVAVKRITEMLHAGPHGAGDGASIVDIEHPTANSLTVSVLSGVASSAPQIPQSNPPRDIQHLCGAWMSAVQPVFYQSEGWHVQAVNIEPTSSNHVTINTLPERGKLQWRLRGTLESQHFLVGRWSSLRPGSTSSGYMALRISSNGQYMYGHDYADVASNEGCSIGVMLLARSEKDLQLAWRAAASGQCQMAPLSETEDFG